MEKITNISELKTRIGKDKEPIELLGYYTSNDGGGGVLYWDDSSTATDDGGSVIQVTGQVTGRWKRVISYESNVLWFGAKPSDNIADAAINMAAFNAAKNALPLIDFPPYLQGGGTVIIPRGTYYLTDTFVIDRGLKVQGGAGSGFLNETVLKFPADTTGILVTAPFINSPIVKAGIGSTIENIEVYSYASGVDKTKHGFQIQGCTFLQFCTASYFSGNGFELFTDASNPLSPNFGNAAFSILQRCRAQGCENGFHTKGGDSNVIKFDTCDATGNRRWGFFEEGFLGNVYTNCHVADNTYAPNNLSQVTHNLSKYICVQDNTNIEPGVTSGWEDYWVDVGNPFGTYFTAWNSSTNYLSGGGYNSYPGFNGDNVFIGCYQEGGQPSQWGLRSIVIGGDLAAALIPKNHGEMRVSASGGTYNFSTGFGFNTSTAKTHTQINADGLHFYPNDAESNASYPLSTYYNPTSFKFITDYLNAGSPVVEVPSNLADPSDFGLAAIKLGVPSYPQGMFINRTNIGSKRFFGYGDGVAPTTGEWAAGDILINASTSNPTVIAVKCTVSGTPGTWTTISTGAGTITDLIVTSASAQPAQITTSNVGGISGSGYYQMATFYAGNMATGNTAQYIVGKTNSPKDAYTLDFIYAGAGSNSNYGQLGLYGTSTGLRYWGSDNVTIGSSSDIGEKLYVAGNVHLGSRTALNSLYVGGLASPVASALVELSSTTQGFLPPRMTAAQRTAISSPAIGLMVYQTDATEGLYINKSGGWTFII